MKVSIKTIKITSVISALSLVIALLMGAEYFKDASQIYLFGISWVTLQNTAFGIFGSAALAAVSAGIMPVIISNGANAKRRLSVKRKSRIVSCWSAASC